MRPINLVNISTQKSKSRHDSTWRWADQSVETLVPLPAIGRRKLGADRFNIRFRQVDVKKRPNKRKKERENSVPVDPYT